MNAPTHFVLDIGVYLLVSCLPDFCHAFSFEAFGTISLHLFQILIHLDLGRYDG